MLELLFLLLVGLALLQCSFLAGGSSDPLNVKHCQIAFIPVGTLDRDSTPSPWNKWDKMCSVLYPFQFFPTPTKVYQNRIGGRQIPARVSGAARNFQQKKGVFLLYVWFNAILCNRSIGMNGFRLKWLPKRSRCIHSALSAKTKGLSSVFFSAPPFSLLLPSLSAFTRE